MPHDAMRRRNPDKYHTKCVYHSTLNDICTYVYHKCLTQHCGAGATTQLSVYRKFV